MRQHSPDHESESQSVLQLSTTHILSLDFRSQLLPLLTNRFTEFTAGGGVHYDFASAQRFLLHQCMCKPQLEIQPLHDFEFVDGDSTGRALTELERAIPQVALPTAVAEAIAEELASETSAKVSLEAVRTVVVSESSGTSRTILK